MILLDKNIDNIDKNIYCVLNSRSGLPTLKVHFDNCDFFISSKYNPINEAEKFAKDKYTENENIFLYGLGMGYHIPFLIDMLKENQRLFVLECNLSIAKIAFENTNIKEYIEKSSKIVVKITESMEDAIIFIKNVLSKKDINFIIYEQCLRAMPESMKEIKDIMTTYNIKIKSHKKFDSLIAENQKYNVSKNYKNGGKIFKDKFKGLACIIVSAGPSLELNIEQLKKAADKAIVIAVGRVAKFLYENNFLPDYFIQTDSQVNVFKHLDIEGLKVPLFMLSTASKELENYKGDKYILYEYYGASEENKPFSVSCGGSVATTAISLAKLMGFSTIIMVGQDLCYWSCKRHSGEEKKVLHKSKTGRYVLGIDGQQYYTSANLYEYLKWIEKFIYNNKDIKFINSTAKGAKIKGALHISITEAVKGFNKLKK